MKFDDDDSAAKAAKKKPVPRRRALKVSLGIAGAVMATAAAATGTRLWRTGAGGNLTAGAGYEPWRAWDSGDLKGIEGIIAAATLASNTYNSQPWKFTVTDNVIDLHADPARGLGALDPFGREMAISLGCAVENMVIGAQALGFTPVLNVLPAGPNGYHVARMTVFPGQTDKPLEATALARRHTHRGLYTRDEKVTTQVIDALYAQTQYTKSRLVWLGGDGPNGKQFAQSTLDAAQAILADNDMRRDSMSWFRRDLAAVNHKADGLTLNASGLSPFMTRMALMAPARTVDKRLADRSIMLTRDVQLASAPMFGLITVPDVNDRTALVEAGRLWQRMHLTATLKNLAMQPMNQMMEMADRDRSLQRTSNAGKVLKELAGFADAAVVFGFRLGYAKTPAQPSPRRDVKQVIA
ncbi:MAG: hypothetical protein K2P94_09950 [Rhodospirillaceae bacterium]|nr:hypothetical protein [Rhodospirillaceae bacterium]